MSSYTFENTAFGSLLVYGGLAITKTLLMTPITIYFRRKYRSASAIEDAQFYAPGKEELQKFLLQPKEEVERVSSLYFSSFVKIKHSLPNCLATILALVPAQ